MTQPIRWPLVAFVLLVSARSVLGDVGDDQFRVAADHYREGRWDLAEAEFQVFVERHAGHARWVEAKFFLAESMVQRARYDDAGRHLAEFVERHADHRLYRQAVFRLGETFYLAGRHAEAREALERFRQLAADDPLNAYALAYLGDLELESGKWTEAAALYAQALERYPDGPLSDDCRHGAARALQRSGDRASAAAIYEHLAASPRPELADDARLQLARFDFDNGEFQASLDRLATITDRAGDPALALEVQQLRAKNHLALRAFDEASSTIEGLSSPDEAATLQFKLAKALRDAERVGEARTAFLSVADRWPSSSLADDAVHAAAVLSWQLDAGDEVVKIVDRLLADYPESEFRGAALELKARSLFTRQDYAGVLETLEPLARGADPVPTPVGYYLALAYLAVDRPADAASVLGRTDLDGASPALVAGVRVAQASALVALKKFGQAIAPLRAAIQAQPDGPDVAHCRAQLVVALAQEARLDEAQVAWNELAGRHDGEPVFLPATLFFAETAYAQGRRALAAQLFAILAENGNPPEYVSRGLSGLAWSQWDSSDPAHSADTFYRLVREFPDSGLAAEAAMMRGAALEKTGKPDPALSMYRFVVEQHPESDRVPAALFAAGRLHQQLKQFDRSAKMLKQLIDEHPDFEFADAAHYQYAWALVDLGKPDEADIVFDTIRERFRESAYWSDAVYRLAERAARAGNHEIADRLAEELVAADRDPKIVSFAIYLRGQLAASTERWPQVEALMAAMIERFPASPMRVAAEYWRAEAVYRQERYDEAGERFAQLERDTGGRGESWLGMISLRRAQVFAQRSEWDRVVAITTAMAERFPEFEQQHEVDYLLGRYYTSRADLAQARAAYARVIDSPAAGKSETAAMAQWMTGETYMMEKDYDSALRAYYRVTSLYAFPRWKSAALLQAGKCHEARGEWHEAVKLYSKLLQQHAETMFAEEAERRLRVARQRATIATID